MSAAADLDLPGFRSAPDVDVLPWSQGAYDGVDLLAVPVARADGEPVPGESARAAADAYGVDLDRVLAAERVSGKAGDVTRVPVSPPDGLPGRLLLVGTGAQAPADLRRAGAALGRAARGRQVLAAALATDPASGLDLPDDATRALMEGLVLGGYTPPSTGTKQRGDSAPVARLRLLVPGEGSRITAAVRQGLRHAAATVRARDLAATPSSVKTPQWLAEQAVRLGEEAGLEVRVWDERELADDGFGGLLAVGRGSARPPRLVRLDYTPAAGRARHGAPVVVVGKGITFDTGGLSIKPREAMVPMKTDMSGAAAVLAALAACPQAQVARRVIGLLPLAENAVGGASYRPGDVIRPFGGRTVEIANTDAEGRLVLADALGYAVARLRPEILVDVATLTGAASLGLGKRHAALFATDEPLAAALAAAGLASGERVWRLPLVEDYAPAVRSQIADLRHVPERTVSFGGGAITAALFLREFTAGLPWAHLDIAGPARADRDEHEVCKGATGYGARLLLHWLQALPPAPGQGGRGTA